MFSAFLKPRTILHESVLRFLILIHNSMIIGRTRFSAYQCNLNPSSLFLRHNYFNNKNKNNIIHPWPTITIARGRLELPTSPLWEARSNQLSYRASQKRRNSMQVRWGGDSNPRSAFADDSLAVSSVRPLRHPTTKKKICVDTDTATYIIMSKIIARSKPLNIVKS